MDTVPQAAARRVLVTGMGLVGPKIRASADLWQMLFDERAPAPWPFPTPAYVGTHRVYAAGDSDRAGPSRTERLALQACEEAVADAGLAPAHLRAAGVFWGSGLGSIDTFEAEGEAAAGAEHQLYEIAQAIAARYACSGPNQVISTACTASLNAIGLAAEWIASGEADVIVVGGAEICSEISLACFDRLGGLDGDRCRPFDRTRAGTVFGEGAGVLVLESDAHFLARGGRQVYCSVDGFGCSCDAYHPTAPEPSGAGILMSMHEALARAGTSADTIGCIIPHGTGTRLNDEVEAGALAGLIGERLAHTPVLPLKAYIGHGAGAAGVFSCAAAALICRHRVVPPAANCDDPEFGLHLPAQAVEVPALRHVLVNGCAFGGNNASVLMGVLQ